ncbi:MAG: hypothetical protein ACRCYD_02450, partial [Plesiomonas sp.]
LQFAYVNNWISNTRIKFNVITGDVLYIAPSVSAYSVKITGDLIYVSITTTSLPVVETSGGGSLDICKGVNDNTSALSDWVVGDKYTTVAWQLEPSNFGTSLIKTSGTAVTREADKITSPRLNNDCVEWYSGSEKIYPIVTADTIEFIPPTGKRHLRNVKGFFTALTPEQKKGLK